MRAARMWFVGLLVAVGGRLEAQAQAPQTERSEGTRVGVGVGLNPAAIVLNNAGSSAFVPFGFGNILIPILTPSGLRIEPEIGYFHSSSSFSQPGNSGQQSSTILRLGLSVTKSLQKTGAARLYVGPRAGIISTSTDQSMSGSFGSSASTAEIDWYVGFVLGGEYFFSNHFSLGGEAQINYIKFGQPSTSGGTSSASTSSSLISNNGLVAVRWYF